MADEPPAPDGPDKLQGEPRTTLSGAIGCLAILVVCCGGVVGIPIAVEKLTLGPDEPGVERFEFSDPGQQFSGLVYFGTFGLLLVGALPVTVGKSKVLGAAVFLVSLGAALAFLWTFAYARPVAARVGDEFIELRYLWPRSSVRLDPAGLASVRAVETDRVPPDNTLSRFYWHLELVHRDGAWTSEDCSNEHTVIDAGWAIRRVASRAALRAAEAANDSAAIARACHAFGVALVLAGRLDEARAHLERAMRLRDPADDLETADTAFALAMLHHRQRAFDLAEPLYRRALGIRSARLDSGHPALFDAIDALVWMLEEAGRPEEAAALRRPRSVVTELRRQYGDEEGMRRFREMMETRRKD